MKLADFSAITVLCVEGRYPGHWTAVRDQVRALGAECSLFLNGPPSSSIVDLFDQINDITPPPTWRTRQADWNHTRAFREIIARAVADRLDSILFLEDDCMFTETAAETLAAITLPDDWEVFYLGAMHTWARTTEAGKCLLSPSGSTCSHAVAIRSTAFVPLLRRALDRHVDDFLCDYFQPRGRTYAAWPQVAIQRLGVSTITGDWSGWAAGFASKGCNWPSA